MKAYWLDEVIKINEEELREHGIEYRFLQGIDIEENKLIFGYSHSDRVELKSDNPKIDLILSNFKKEHSHKDPEARYILEGNGLFDIRSNNDKWIRIEVSSNDYIVIPAFRNHRFDLNENKYIKAVRLFRDNPSWEPIYREQNEN